MSTTVCLLAMTINYPQGGGHLWVYLNWALGLRSLGCEVIWLEAVNPKASTPEVRLNIAALKARLDRHGLAESIALCSRSSEPLSRDLADECMDFEAASEADSLLNFRYATRSELVDCFRRTALMDVDPGLLQLWMSAGKINVAQHDVYFSIGETVGQPGARFQT